MKKKKRSALVDLAIAGLISAIVPAAGAWQSRAFTHAEVVTRQADDQIFRMASLRLQRERALEHSCAAALSYLADERLNPAITKEKNRTLALAAERRASTCLLPSPAGTKGPHPIVSEGDEP